MRDGTVRWVYAFLDSPPDEVDVAWAFWSAATATTLSPARGPEGQFATLLPEHGEAWLKVQRLAGLPPGGRVHIDLAVDGRRSGLEAARARARSRGAEVDLELGDVIVMRSPGGFPFCLTSWEEYGGPACQVRAGSRLLDQVCLDIPLEHHDREVGFWAALTGWDVVGADDDGEFSSLVRPTAVPVRLLLQRLHDETGPVRGHLDFASEDRDTEVADLERLGARAVERFHGWTVMEDPAGRVFCVTDRRPTTGIGG